MAKNRSAKPRSRRRNKGGWNFDIYRHDRYGQLKTCLGNAVAYSYAENPHNLEHPWYAPWSHVCHSLVQDIPNAVIGPQFPICIPRAANLQKMDNPQTFTRSDSDSDSEGESSSSDTAAKLGSDDRVIDESSGDSCSVVGPPDSDSDNSDTESVSELSDNDMDEETESEVEDENEDNTDSWEELGNQDHNNSLIVDDDVPVNQDNAEPTASTRTTSSRKSKIRYPDSTIYLANGEFSSASNIPTFCGGIRIHSINIGAIFENKRGISRSELDPKKVGRVLVTAQRQVLQQAAHVFLNHDQTTVIGVAAVGPFWTYSILEPSHVAYMMKSLTGTANFLGRDPPPKWRKHVQLGSVESNRLFSGIHTKLKEMSREGCQNLGLTSI
ncbi:hypothetical protein QCA50_006441 [Cerrena zonata]|uniref:Uncharacterized protein n=1 Tax=Cerrena zonata TaxID=2478898 RepID=A0AAW0GIR6_9APHY